MRLRNCPWGKELISEELCAALLNVWLRPPDMGSSPAPDCEPCLCTDVTGSTYCGKCSPDRDPEFRAKAERLAADAKKTMERNLHARAVKLGYGDKWAEWAAAMRRGWGQDPETAAPHPAWNPDNYWTATFPKKARPQPGDSSP